MNTNDSPEYLERKRFFESLLTIFGRKPVLEALQDDSVKIHRLHLASSNRSDGIITEISQLAKAKGAEILYHDRQELSRISKNAKQDQGVAADLICSAYGNYQDFLNEPSRDNYQLLAVDSITNPQNLGMIIRSVCAGFVDGLILPEKGCAKLDALVIKASTGTLFRTRILRCKQLHKCLDDFRQHEENPADVYGLSSHAKNQLKDVPDNRANIFVLGNETHGVSEHVAERCNKMLAIPMNNDVESLNVAVTASLIAFRGQI
ncbi:RNA methyltransferase [uncultured Pseudoteredinibacter sp.]|uniref:TrmH family RNA methyltransferase n=1 Tax=uncultured Pseudoteredinibacter sp. TaxID=1641701 RepID=UPI00261BBA25|nr:RNA methyltransferase [uncultured Pseudoteredinibacter sp.]